MFDRLPPKGLTSYDRSSLPNGVDTPTEICYPDPKSGAFAPLSKGIKMNAITAKAGDVVVGDVVQYSNGVTAEITYIDVDIDMGFVRYIITTFDGNDDFTRDYLLTDTLEILA